MKLVFRSSSVEDLKWFRSYYTSVFPEGANQAKRHYLQTCRTLVEHPFVGHPVGPNIPVRELFIPRTPFSFVYYVAGQEIIIIRVLDARAVRPGDLTI